MICFVCAVQYQFNLNLKITIGYLTDKCNYHWCNWPYVTAGLRSV